MTNRLLIADDAPIIRAMIRDAATQAGWEVVGEAGNGQEAVEKYRDLKPNVVTMDVVMPEFDGIHGLTEIRRLDSDARVVMVSALSQKEYLKKAFSEGALDFICKPFEANSLVEALEKASRNAAASAPA